MTETQKEHRIGIGPVVLVVIHVILTIIALCQLLFVAPVFGEMFADFGAALPGPTQMMLNLSDFCKRYGLFLLPVLMLLLAGDVMALFLLPRMASKTALWIWLWSIMGALLLLNVIILLSIYAPLSYMQEVVSG